MCLYFQHWARGGGYTKDFCGSLAMSIAELVRPRLTETPSGKITCEVILDDAWHHSPDSTCLYILKYIGPN